jgi:hypothetical protein
VKQAGRIFWSLVIAGILSAGSAQALELVDDQGEPIRSSLEICFQIDLATRCVSVPGAAGVSPPAEYQSVRIEGPDHGPNSFQRRDVQLAQAPLRIVRKARLRIENLPQEPLTVSLYNPKEADFRTPLVRFRAGSAGIKIPAGDHIASLAAGRKAPDLQRLSAPPGGDARLTYRPREGWSLLLRCREAGADRRLPRANVEVAGIGSYAETRAPVVSTSTGEDGLAFVSGLRHALATAAVRHPDFVPQELHGLTATPGTFGFREVELRKGGTIQTKVLLHEQPRAGVLCRLVESEARPGRKPELRELWTSQTDSKGVCRSRRLPAGSYILEVAPPESRSFVSRPVEALDGVEVEEEVSLQATRVAGQVVRGTQPAAGYSVTVHDLGFSSQGGHAPAVTRAVTNEDGEYEMTLWVPGTYRFGLESPSGTAVATNRRVEIAGEEETVDFVLSPASFRGRVVDQAGRPVAEARAALRWGRGLLIAMTDQEGVFEIPVESEEPIGTLTAAKRGYESSEPLQVTLPREGEVAPVELVLNRMSLRRGMVLSPSGAPLSGVLVASLGVDSEGNPTLHNSTLTDAEGRFEIDARAGAPVRGLLGGIGCPLAPFALSAEVEETALQCQPLPSALELSLRDAAGRPVPKATVILRRNGEIIPRGVLGAYLDLLRLPAETDATGHLVLVGLAPGQYDLFLAGSSSESTVRAGWTSGFLSSVSLAPLSTTELEIKLADSRGAL